MSGIQYAAPALFQRSPNITLKSVRSCSLLTSLHFIAGFFAARLGETLRGRKMKLPDFS